MAPTDDDRPVNRRRFFREGLRELLKPLAAAIEPLEEAARQLGQMESLSQAAATRRATGARPRSIPLNLPLRPPGANEEQQFRQTCSRGGECVRACPAQCIKIDPNGVIASGVPYIDADVMPCVLCESLACMQVCSSGALVPTALNDIDMGTAVWHRNTCIRTVTDPQHPSGADSNCTICVDRCPIGSFAIALVEGDIAVKEDGCTGCGVCQHECPTGPKSIVVMPKSIRPA